MTKRGLLFILLLSLSMAALSGCSSSDEESDETTIDEIADEGDSVGDETASDDSSQAGDDQAEQEVDEFEAEEEAANQKEEVAEDEVEPAEESEEEVAEEEKTSNEEVAQESTREEPRYEQEAASPPSEITNRIASINFLSTTNGGTIEIKTDTPAQYKVREKKDTNQFVVEVPGALLPENLKRPYIMKDFEGNFGAINAYQKSGGTIARIVIQMKGPGTPVVAQEGSSLLVTLANGESLVKAETAPTLKEQEKGEVTPDEGDSSSYDVQLASKDEKILGARSLDEFLTGTARFYGTPISLQYNDADIRDVINMIADESGINLVLSDDVQGKVSIKLRKVPWDQALVIIMRAKGLGYVRQGNVLRITSLAALQSEAQAAKQVVDAQNTLAPLKVKVIPINYGAVGEVQTQVTSFLSPGRGKVVSDARTSSLIVTDTTDVLEKIERLILELDTPPPQVMIEGKIVEAGESFTRSLGVNWRMSGDRVTLNENGGSGGRPLTLDTNFFSSPTTSAGVSRFSLSTGVYDILGTLDATLSLAQADQLVRIISSPRIVTMNKTPASILQSNEIITISSTLSANGVAIPQVSRDPVQLSLNVTPQITSEGSVILDVDVQRQFPGGAISSGAATTRPRNSRSAKTKVLVGNGQTAVIGGIYQSDESEGETGTPGLKDIPVLGWLFKSKNISKEKNELLIFITPRVLNAKDQAVKN